MSNSAPPATVKAVEFTNEPTSLMRMIPLFTVMAPAVACLRSGMWSVKSPTGSHTSEMFELRFA